MHAKLRIFWVYCMVFISMSQVMLAEIISPAPSQCTLSLYEAIASKKDSNQKVADILKNCANTKPQCLAETKQYALSKNDAYVVSEVQRIESQGQWGLLRTIVGGTAAVCGVFVFWVSAVGMHFSDIYDRALKQAKEDAKKPHQWH